MIELTHTHFVVSYTSPISMTNGKSPVLGLPNATPVMSKIDAYKYSLRTALTAADISSFHCTSFISFLSIVTYDCIRKRSNTWSSTTVSPLSNSPPDLEIVDRDTNLTIHCTVYCWEISQTFIQT